MTDASIFVPHVFGPHSVDSKEVCASAHVRPFHGQTPFFVLNKLRDVGRKGVHLRRK
jgi:hypothetical protein